MKAHISTATPVLRLHRHPRADDYQQADGVDFGSGQPVGDLARLQVRSALRLYERASLAGTRASLTLPSSTVTAKKAAALFRQYRRRSEPHHSIEAARRG